MKKNLLLTLLFTFNFLLVGCGENSSSYTPPEEELLAENEPYFKYAWHLNAKNTVLNSSGYSIDENADINILEAWKITQGEGVKVAIIDNSFDVSHEDLKENIYHAYNADDGSTDVSPPSLASSHGSRCASFIASPINAKGLVGVAPKSKIIAIKLLSDLDSKNIEAFEYAKNQGAKVINCSWGTENLSPALDAQLKSLYEAGITVVFASGNDGKSLDDPDIYDESESPWVIGVSASSELNDITVYSNYGSNLELMAPGGDIDTLGVLTVEKQGYQDNMQYGLVRGDYTFTNGTSYSAPIVTGVAALIYSIKPDITPAQVRSILINSTQKVGASSANYVNGFDTKRAYGKLDATQALKLAQTLKP